MLKINKLTLNPLFKNVSLEIKSGIIGIFGPSGSGKTTFLKTIGGFIQTENGEVLFNNHKIVQGKIVNSNFKLGFHFQDYNLLDLDVETNINLPFTIGGYKKDINWINYLLEYFEIESLINKKISRISGGEKERVSIVKSLANKPDILLLDEAGSALDESLKNKLYRFLLDYSKEHIIIFISHDIGFIDKLGIKNNIYKGQFQINIEK